MKIKLKQSFQDFVEYIAIPTIVYIKESSKIVAMNQSAKNIVGDKISKMRLLWKDKSRLIDENIDKNGSLILYNRELNCEQENRFVDLELNYFLVDNEHLVIVFMDYSYKRVFFKNNNVQIPRLFWKNKKLEFIGWNKSFEVDTNIERLNEGKKNNLTLLRDVELSEKITGDEKWILENKDSSFDIIQTLTLYNGNDYFVKMHRMPIVNKNGTIVTILGVYTQILDRYEKYNQSSDYEEQSGIFFNDVISNSNTIYIRISEKPFWPVEYISPNISNYGYEAEKFYFGNMNWSDIIYSEDYNRLFKLYNNVKEEGINNWTWEYRLVKANKEIAWISAEMSSIFIDGKLVGREGILNDITEKKLLEEKLNKKKKVDSTLLEAKKSNTKITQYYKSMDMILNNIQDIVIVISKDSDCIYYINKSGRDRFGKNVIDNNIIEMFIEQGVFPYDIHTNKNINYVKHINVNNLLDSVNQIFYDIKYSTIKWINNIECYLLTLSNITKYVHYNNALEKEIGRDFLTGLPNRLKFDDDAAYLIAEALKYNKSGVIILMDLDDFQRINNNLGFLKGDELMKSMAHTLMNLKCINGHCYRFGGDEFAIVIDSNYSDSIESIINSIVELFNQPWRLNDKEYSCTMSMGIVEYPNTSKDLNDLLKYAQIALYTAKDKGKNCVEFYSNTTNQYGANMVAIMKQLRDDIKKGFLDFHVEYQPIVDITTSKVIGAEALLRWESMQLGKIMPSEFIPMSEYLGLITPLGEFVLHEALISAKSWLKLFGYNFLVSINFSQIQLKNSSVIERICEITRNVGIKPKNIVLEITELAFINDLYYIRKICNQLKTIGYKIALDNYGLSNTEILGLNELELDFIKIDKSCIAKWGTNILDNDIIKQAVELTTNTKVQLIVEGIETKEQALYLEQFNFYAYQGYYYGKPVVKEEFI